MKRRQLDELWKGILENTFEDFLRFINPSLDAMLDFKRGIVFLDKELDLAFGENRPGTKIVDKLARVYTIGGNEEYILVHVEVQGKYREDFSERMFEYYYRIFDQYHKPITAYAIFLESNNVERPDRFEQSCMGTNLIYQYNTLKVASQNDEELIASHNPFALAVLTAKTSLMLGNAKDNLERDKRLYAYKRKLLRLLISRKIPKEKIQALLYFLRFYVNFENKEFSIKFENKIKSLTDNNHLNMGIEEQLVCIWLEEGEQAGLKKAKEKEVLNLIAKLGFSSEQAADFAEVSVSYVEKLRRAQPEHCL